MWSQQTVTDEKLVYVNNNTGEQCSLSRVYTHPELGKFYAFDNLLQMPYQRKYIFDLAQQYERVGMEKNELDTRLSEIQELCRIKKEGFEFEVYSIAQFIRSSIKDMWDFEKTSMLIAAMVIVQPDENIAIFDQQQAERKIALWRRDKTMLAFFLNILQQRCSSLLIPSVPPIQKYSVPNPSL
jgi:hypothetical protein